MAAAKKEVVAVLSGTTTHDLHHHKKHQLLGSLQYYDVCGILFHFDTFVNR